MQAITHINPPTLRNAPDLGYSQISVVEPGRMAYVSGQSGLPLNEADISDDLKTQTHVATGHLRNALDALKAEPSDIVILRCIVTQIEPADVADVFDALGAFLDGAQPCITLYCVKELVLPELKISLETVIRLPDASAE